jgi:hypothetical protein
MESLYEIISPPKGMRKIGSFIARRTGIQTLRRNIARRIPQSQQIPQLQQLRQALVPSPLAGVEAELRRDAFDLYNDLGGLWIVAEESIYTHNRLSDLIDQIEHGKSRIKREEAMAGLRQLFSELGARALGMRESQEIEDFLASLRDNSNQGQAQRNAELLEYAKLWQELSTPTIQALQITVIAGASRLEKLINLVVPIEALREPLDVLWKTSGDLVKASQAEVKTFNAIAGEINIVIATTKLVNQLTAFTTQLQTTLVPDKMKQIATEAQETILEARRLNLLPTPPQQVVEYKIYETGK